MFKGELTPFIEELDYKCNIPKRMIGMKQTGRLQATDVKFAKMVKDTGRTVKRTLRRAQRARAKREKVAAKLESGMYELMTLVTQMHATTVQASRENHAVLSAVRMGGFMAYEVDPTCAGGINPAVGEKWKAYPLGSSRLGATWMGSRLAWRDGAGECQPPDWKHLRDMLNKKKRPVLAGQTKVVRRSSQ